MRAVEASCAADSRWVALASRAGEGAAKPLHEPSLGSNTRVQLARAVFLHMIRAR